MTEKANDEQTQDEQTQLEMNQEEKQERIRVAVLKNTVLAQMNESRFGLECVLEKETVSLVFTGDDGQKAGNAVRAFLLDKGFCGLKELEEREHRDIDYRTEKLGKTSTNYVLKDLVSEHFEGIILDEEERGAIFDEKEKARPILTQKQQSPETSVAADKEAGIIAFGDGPVDSGLPAASDDKINNPKEESTPTPIKNVTNAEPPHTLKNICQFLRSYLPKSWQVKAAGSTLASAVFFGVAIVGFFASFSPIVSGAYAFLGVLFAICAVYCIAVSGMQGLQRLDKTADQSKQQVDANQIKTNDEPESVSNSSVTILGS